MKLSVVIVNYNVKFFLEQCIHTVNKAVCQAEKTFGANSCEVFVVDNDSSDGSCAMMKEKFPEIQLIENKKNLGFSKANNQAIRISQGEYVLLLNPDTVVQEDTFAKIIDFMDSHPDAGGLGVKMIDGSGNFLPESKRALPTPEVSFYKIFGLSSLFPKSRKFGKYHLGYLSKDETNEVDVLSGAFMMLRKEALDKAGLLDEAFFMYGEDIDLSYRITLAGYKNYYYPGTAIIHYKGESTKKGSLNYVFIFYNAMIIFANKHFSKKNAKIFSFFINSAVWFRATISILKRIVTELFLPLSDAIIFFAGFYILKPHWESYRFPTGGEYPDEYLFYAVPSYIVIWLLSMFFFGGYDRPAKFSNFLKGILYGTLSILVIYSLLDEQYRFSRALILIGSLWGIIFTVLYRKILGILKFKEFSFKPEDKKNVLIVATLSESDRINELLQKTHVKYNILGIISPDEQTDKGRYLGSVSKIQTIININKADEIIFSLKDLGSTKIIELMLILSHTNIEFKIAPEESFSVIGSNSMHTPGELYVVNIDSISKKRNKRKKRLFDISASIFILMFSPILLAFVVERKRLINNVLNVLLGKISIVGYSRIYNESGHTLPEIKTGILNPLYTSKKIKVESSEEYLLNATYAKNYKIINDLTILRKGFNHLGKQV